jgi:hypothetical protein
MNLIITIVDDYLLIEFSPPIHNVVEHEDGEADKAPVKAKPKKLRKAKPPPAPKPDK